MCYLADPHNPAYYPKTSLNAWALLLGSLFIKLMKPQSCACPSIALELKLSNRVKHGEEWRCRYFLYIFYALPVLLSTLIAFLWNILFKKASIFFCKSFFRFIYLILQLLKSVILRAENTENNLRYAIYL